ncbi:MAG: DUF72 domain-containing protein, partial [Acidobacteriales bacterium]|nr:DUF72 domain-containing protein [Terriglobales bacterium]
MKVRPSAQTTARHPSQADIRVGTAGWTIPAPTASHFPGTGSHLERYSRTLPCAEINTSFYRPHRQSTWERWAAAVPSGFRFSVKAPRAITHEGGLKCDPPLLKAFLEQASYLGPQLGPLLFQFPPKFAFEPSHVRRFLMLLRGMHSGPVAWEPRHASWFEDSASKLLLEFDVARVAADPACAATAGVPDGSQNLTYYRWHGSPRRYYSSYPEMFLNNLAETLIRPRAESVWCIFDNTASGA